MYLDTDMKHRNSYKTGMRIVSRCHCRRHEIAAESPARLKEVISNPKEPGTLIRKTAPQNFKDVNPKYHDTNIL